MITQIFDYISDLINYFSESNRGLYTTVATGAAGYIPDIVPETEMIDNIFKYGIWSLSIIIGVFTIIGLVQRQVDRCKEKSKERKRNRFYYQEEEDDD